MRNFEDWLNSYCDWASFTEAPRRLHFWSGVSAVAGALRRHVWVDMGAFQWLANHFIVFVAPPGIVAKSTTAGLASGLLHRVPGIRFGPSAVTAAALAKSFAEAHEEFEIAGTFYPHCALTLVSSELGNLIDPKDRQMIDLLTELWDGLQVDFTKVTKTSGSDTIINPWINLIACTTPAWLAANFPEYVLGGGFTSRCIFVYADKKEHLIAYPSKSMPPDFIEVRDRLVADLDTIANTLLGPVTLTAGAYSYGETWYNHLHTSNKFAMSDDRLEHWLAREQAHLHKLAIVLSASRRDDLVITEDELGLADTMLQGIEADIPTVFDKIGRAAGSNNSDRFLKYIEARNAVPMQEAIRYIKGYFPQIRVFTGMIQLLSAAGQLKIDHRIDGQWVSVVEPKPSATPPTSPLSES